MKLRLLILVAVLLAASSASAQNPAAPTDHFEWDIAGPSLAVVSAYRYDVEVDAAPPTALAGVTCLAAGATFTCRAPIPAVTPSQHTVRVRAVDVSGTPILGPFSAPFSFTMRAVPAAPTGVRIVPPGA